MIRARFEVHQRGYDGMNVAAGNMADEAGAKVSG
jgi:hypothetical protein